MKQVILIRHGETEKDKSNPSRGLTSKGVKQILDSALHIGPLLKGSVAIICSKTPRARQTADIIAKQLQIENVSVHDLRIQGAKNIEETIMKNNSTSRPAKVYLTQIKNYEKYQVESPAELSKRWTQILTKTLVQTVIVVGHEASLEAFLYNQKTYTLIKKNFRKYFNYGNWAYLVDSDLV